MANSTTYRFIIPVAALSLGLCMVGCTNSKEKAEHENLVKERDQYQSLFQAATTRQADTDQKLTDADAKLQKTKDELAAAKVAQEEAAKDADAKLKSSEEAKEAAQRKCTAVFKESAAKLKAADEALAAAKAKQSESESQLTAANEKVAALQKEVDALTTQNESLKSDLAKATAPPPAPTTKPVAPAAK